MAKKKRGRKQSNRSPQRWLAMSLYPIILAILFFGVTLGGWAAEAVKSDPSIDRDYDDRDADDWLNKLGITDLDDDDGAKEAAIDDLLDALGLDIDLDDIEKGKLDEEDLDALGLGELNPDDITPDAIISKINELIEDQIAKNIVNDTDISDESESDDWDNNEDADTNENLDDDESADESEDDWNDWYEDDDSDETDSDDYYDDDYLEEEDNDIEEFFEQYYYYNFCSEEDKVLYKEVYEIFRDRKTFTPVSATDTEDLNRIYNYVMADHPEFFYVWGANWRSSSMGLAYKGNYTYSEAELIINQQLNETAAQQIVDSVPAGLSEYETIKYFYNYLVDNTTYELGSEWNQEISSVFINHVSVCAGYARAMQYLLQLKGIQCLYIVGDAGGPHAWNVVRVDDKYYQLDVCWADPNNPDIPNPDYAYLCIPTSRIGVNHTADEDVNPLPDCASMDANYYVQEDLYLESFDPERIAQIFEKSKIENNGTVYIMASDAGTYAALKDYVITQHHIWELYYGEGKTGDIRYLPNDELYTLSVYELK